MSKNDVKQNSKSVSEWVKKIIEELKIRHKLEFDALKILKTGTNVVSTIVDKLYYYVLLFKVLTGALH